MSPLETTCKHCMAGQNEPCKGLPVGEYHAERQESADFIAHTLQMEPGGYSPTKEEFDRVVDELDLF